MPRVVVVPDALFSGIKGKRDIDAYRDLICDSVFKTPVDFIPEVFYIQSCLRYIGLVPDQFIPKLVGIVHAEKKFSLVPGFGPAEAGNARARSATTGRDISLSKGERHH